MKSMVHDNHYNPYEVSFSGLVNRIESAVATIAKTPISDGYLSAIFVQAEHCLVCVEKSHRDAQYSFISDYLRQILIAKREKNLKILPL